jgi:hypothetical protein
VNSKQIVAAVSAVVLVVILAYPALSTGTVSILLRSPKTQGADHIYALVGDVWVHRLGQPSSEGWEPVFNQTQTVDLISLDNTTMAFAKQQIPVGGYDGIRMEVSNVTWVFSNRTTSRLSVESPQIQTKLMFTAQAGREVTITMVLSGQMKDVTGTKFFASNLNATLSGVSGP